MHVFVISLKSSVKRRERMSRLLSKVGVEFKFVDGVIGADLTSQQMIEKGLSPHSVASKAEIGVMLSHMTVWQNMVDEDIAVALILEDDVHFGASFNLVVNAIRIPSDQLGLFRLETVLASVDVDLKPVQSIQNITIHQIYSNHSASAGYMLNTATARHLLGQVGNMRISFDNELFDPVRRNIKGVDVFQCVPGVVVQDAALMKSAGTLGRQDDFLKSMIGDERIDYKIGLKEYKESTFKVRLRDFFRPAYLFFYSLLIYSKGKKRLRIPFEN